MKGPVAPLACVCAVLLALACASAPPLPAPGRASIWGRLRVLPHEGVSTTSSGSRSYGDRRFADATLVDYSRPGFAVVYLATGAVPIEAVAVHLRDGDVEPRFEPSQLAAGLGGRLVVRNESREARNLASPQLGVLRRLEPGTEIEIRLDAAGDKSIYLIGASAISARIFVAPGPFAKVSSTGRYEIRDLEPGRHELNAWHPRLPPTRVPIDLAPDARVRIDLEMGVGRGTEMGDVAN